MDDNTQFDWKNKKGFEKDWVHCWMDWIPGEESKEKVLIANILVLLNVKNPNALKETLINDPSCLRNLVQKLDASFKSIERLLGVDTETHASQMTQTSIDFSPLKKRKFTDPSVSSEDDDVIEVASSDEEDDSVSPGEQPSVINSTSSTRSNGRRKADANLSHAGKTTRKLKAPSAAVVSDIQNLCLKLSAQTQSTTETDKIAVKLSELLQQMTSRRAIELLKLKVVQSMFTLACDTKNNKIKSVAIKVLECVASERTNLEYCHKRVIFDLGVTALIKSLLGDGGAATSTELKEQGLHLVRCFSGEAVFAADMIAQGMLTVLSEFASYSSARLYHICVELIEKLVRHQPVPSLLRVQPLLPFLTSALTTVQDHVTLIRVLTSIFFITFSENNDMNSVYLPAVFAQENLVQRVVSILDTDTRVAVCEAANRVVGNLSGGTVAHRQALIALGVIPALKKLLVSTPKPHIAEHVCRTLSNLCYHDEPEQMEDIHTNKVLRKLVKYSNAAQQDTEGFVALNVVFAVKNALDPATEQQVGHIIRSGGVDLLCGYLLRFGGNNKSAVKVSEEHLRGLEIAIDAVIDVISYCNEDTEFSRGLAQAVRPILKAGQLVESIGNLKSHSCEAVKSGAIDLEKNYLLLL